MSSSETMSSSQDSAVGSAATAIGRLLIATIFIWAAFGKIGGFDGTVTRIANTGMPIAQFATIGAIIIELGGGLMLLAGFKTRWAAVALAVFSLAAAVLFHNYWGAPAAQTINQQIHFLKNLAIIGGLLFVFAHGPGAYSVDKK